MTNPKDLVGAKKAPLRYVPPAGAIESSGPHEDGAIKYGPFNWRETPVEMVTYLEAIDRHLAALKDGQDFAEDSGYSHIGHIIAGANIIADAKAHGTLIDNRFAKGPAADMLRARDKSVKPPTTIEEAGVTSESIDLIADGLRAFGLIHESSPKVQAQQVDIRPVLCNCGPVRARYGDHLITCPRFEDTALRDLEEPHRDIGGEG